MATIEDLEMESNGRYVRVSIDDLTDDEEETIRTFITAVVRLKKVPRLVNGGKSYVET